MGNKCKRFLVVLMMTLLLVSAVGMNAFAAEPQSTALECYTYGDVNGDDAIDQKDAIYLLDHTLFGESLYPLNGRGGDMDGDGDTDKDDAIHLLFHTFPSFAEEYPLAIEGEVHGYFEPVWTWWATDGDSGCMAATMTVKCACGGEYVQTEDVYPEVKAAECTEDGYEKYSVTMSFNGKDYEGAYEVVLPALGHDVTPTCGGVAVCKNGCGYSVEPLAHTWEKVSETAASCSTAGQIAYGCSACGDAVKTEVIPATGAHSYGEEVVVPVEGKDCTFEKVKSCGTCGHKVTSGAYEEHSYTDKVAVTHATCTAAGEKVYTCDNCDSTKEEVIPVNPEAHGWQTADGSHYTCACGAEKDVVAVENNTDIDRENLDRKELALAEGTALSLDGDSVENLPADQVQVSVKDVAGQLDLTEEQKEAIGDNPVYDFNMTYVDENGDTKPVSDFSGTVTVTLPYELGEGEDPESIAVWYIDGNGETQSIHAAYANGYITFTTNHFSYYTVTRLKPAERCALYGHKYGIVPLTVEPTCTEDGYTYQVCQRCAHVDVMETAKAKGHKYENTVNASDAACGQAGMFSQKCAHCKDLIEYELPALAHDYDVAATDATCEAAGKKIYSCKNCDHSYEEVLPKLEHDTQEETKAPTCDENGYTKLVCKNCDYELVTEAHPAKGHSFPASNDENAEVMPEWTWNWEDDLLIDVMVGIHCMEEGCDYTRTLTAVVTEVDETGCEGGDVVYYAKAGYNGHGFEHPPYRKHKDGEGHKHGDVWHQDAVKHYHKCSVCKEMYDSDEHNWDEGTVKKEASCTKEGQVIYKCTVCGYEKKEKIEATNKHDLKNGVCVDCGFESNECKHVFTQPTVIDLGDYGACEGGSLTIYSCECGQERYLGSWEVACAWKESYVEETVDAYNGSMSGWRYVCPDCGLTYESIYGGGYTEDPCAYYYMGRNGFTINGEVIFMDEYCNVGYEHPSGNMDSEFEKIDLREYGLCGEIWQKSPCPCGEQASYMKLESCNWVIDEERTTDTLVVFVCEDCGGECWEVYDYYVDEERCMQVSIFAADYYVGGEKVYTISYTANELPAHDLKVADYGLKGEVCTDELWVTWVCTRCDYEYTEGWGFHIGANSTTLDLRKYDICYEYAEISTCLCSMAIREGYLWSYGDYCLWEEVSTGDDSKQVYVCSECGAKKEVAITIGALDENCTRLVTEKNKVTDKNGNHIVTYYNDNLETTHSYEEKVVLKGQSCEEGVSFVNTCTRCGYSYSRSYNNHQQRIVERIDVSKIGMCYDEVAIWACGCGESMSLGYSGTGSNRCEWNYVGGDHNTDIYECEKCGVRETIMTEELDAIDDCYSRARRTYTYTRNGATRSVSYIGKIANHQFVADMELLPGATDCTEGYTVTMRCTICGYSYESGREYAHVTYPYEKTPISVGQLCGDLYFQKGSCACGKETWQGTVWYNGSCDFEYNIYDETLGCHINRCMTCGAFYYTEERTDTPVEGTCFVDVTELEVYMRDGKELFRHESAWRYEDHRWEYDFDLLGETCNDGYTYIRTCTRCGEAEESELDYGCTGHNLGRELVYDGEGICSPYYVERYICACGRNSGMIWEYDCQFEWGYEEDTGKSVEVCQNCGLVRDWTEVHSALDDRCQVQASRRYIFKLKGKQLFTLDRDSRETHHSWSYDVELLGETCEDGYTYVRTCKSCGMSENSGGVCYGCGWMPMDDVQIHGGEGICGPIYFMSDGCACGRLSSNWTTADCSFDRVYWDEELERNVSKCSYCGVGRYEDVTYSIPDENCDQLVTKTMHVVLDGEELAAKTITYTEKAHTWTYKFNMLGQFCADGYTYTNVCVKCGIDGGESAVRYGCENYGMGDNKVIYDGEGICGPITAESYRCACGINSGTWIDFACGEAMDGWSWDEELEEYVYKCYGCGLRYSDSDRWLEDGENCIKQYLRTYTFYLGEEILTYECERRYPEHDWVYDHLLVEGGTSCEDGYYVNSVCQDCGYTYRGNSIYTGHEKRTVRCYRLKDYGLCGGEIYVYSCACEQSRSVSWSNGCDWDETGKSDPATGAQEEYCAECGTYRYYLSSLEHNRAECRTEGRFYYKLVRDGETVLLIDQETGAKRHTLIATEMKLENEYGPTDSCEEGYLVVEKCLYCDESSASYGSGHDEYITRRIELPEGSDSCGRYLLQYSCACGKYQSYEYSGSFVWEDRWEEKDEKGVVHTYDRGTCSLCGMTVLLDEYIDLEEGSCYGTSYEVLYVTLSDNRKETLVDKNPGTFHDYGPEVYTLLEDSETCMDGILCTQYCQREGCGETYTWTGHPGGHYYLNLADSIDLTQYGSICGESLDYFVCPCGAEYRWSFDEENHCDLDQKSTGLNWLNAVIEKEIPGGRLVDDTQYTTEGWVYSESYAYIFTCAVTDPEACGLKVRMAEYWVKVGCEVREYQTWQLGYDPATGSCPYEFTVATGEKHAYHDYEYSRPDEYDENGNTTLNVELETCPDCGSYVKYQYFYENGEHVKTEWERVNTLNNGEMKRYYILSEYGEERQYEYNGYTGSYRYNTLTRYEYVYADGSVYWDQYVHTYDFEESCKRTDHYTDSNGADETDVVDCHNGGWEREDIEQPTCTQFGSWREWYVCYVCGEISDEYTYNYNPVAHYWYWVDDLQLYRCSVCGLENLNGASGNVVMEDMTEARGGGTDYVIGYWNRGKIDFAVEISVIFNDRAEDHEDGNQFVLTGIEIADHTKEDSGFVGKSFSKAEAYRAAEVKMAEQGYQGSYSIRINFVPVNDTTDLDYAITFDPVGAAA